MATNKSGYAATLTVSSLMTSLTDIRVEINHEPIDVTTLASTWRGRVEGILDWRVTGTRNYTATKFLKKAVSGATTFQVGIANPSGTTIFSATGLITRALVGFPTDASTEEIEVVGMGTAPTVV